MHYSIIFDHVTEDVGCMELIKHNTALADRRVFIVERH